MPGKPVGTIFAELDLDKTKFTRAQNTILKEAGVVTMGVEKNYKTLGIKSATIFDAMRKQAENAYQGIKHSARATADDIVRAEKAKDAKLKRINEEQYGRQISLISRLKSNWMAYAAAIGTIGYGFSKVIKDASDLQESMSKFETVFKGQVGYAKQWAQTLTENYAMSTREAVKYLGSVQDLLVPMGMAADAAGRMSNEVVKMSADLGSFNNLPTEQVILDIQSALVGNFETMKKYGVVLNATTTQQRALDDGLANTKEELTAADKAMAAFKIITEGSTAAIGDMARTSDGFANQLKAFNAEWEDLSATIGTTFLPVATDVIKALREMITLASGGGDQGFWSFFWGENKFEENKRMAEEALAMATSYKDEFSGLDSSGGVPTPKGGDNTPADNAKIGEIGKDFWQMQADDKYEVLSRQYADEEALENEYRETRLAKIIEDHKNALALVEEKKKAEIDSMNAIAKGEQWLADQKRKSEEDKKKLQAQTMKGALDNTKFALKAIGQENAAAFEAFKAISIAETVVNTAKAAMGAYSAMSSIPYVGPVLGAAAAAAAIAAGVAQIATISSMSPGGGGGGASSGGFSGGAVGTYSASPTTGLPETTETKEPTQTINLHFENYIDSDENNRSLVQWLNEYVQDKGGTLVASDARTAEKLA